MGEAATATRVFDTAAVAPHERRAYWCDAVCESYVSLACDGMAPDFNGSIRLTSLPALGLSEVRAAGQDVRRRRANIARDTDEFFLLSVQKRGRGVVVQGDRAAVLEPGDAALYSSSERYRLLFEDRFEQLVVQLPKASLLERVPQADMLTAVRLPAGIAGTCLNTMVAGVAGSPAVGHAHLARAAVDLVASDLAALAGEARMLPVAETRARIHEVMRALAHDAGATREDVARRSGMSVRRVNEVLAAFGGSLTRDLAAIRLDGARAQIARCGGRLRMADVAARWGFRDQAAFSRTYRRRFGRPPSRDARPGIGNG